MSARHNKRDIWRGNPGRALRLLLVAVLVTLSAVTGASAAAAAPAPAPVFSFIVNTRTVLHIPTVAFQVLRKGGQIHQAYPQLGVLLVRSTDQNFAARMRNAPGVLSAGAARTVPVRTSNPPPPPQPPAAHPASPADEQWNMRAINAPAAHQVTRGDPRVVVGVLDSGIDPTNPRLAGAIDTGSSVSCVDGGRPDTRPDAWRPDGIPHGTAVAGLIAARGGAGDLTGVAPASRVASVKVADATGLVYPEYAICGLVWSAEHRFAIANQSFFVDPWLFVCATDPDQKAIQDAVSRAMDYAERHRVLSVVAAGNEGFDLVETTVDAGSPDDSTPITRQLDRSCKVLPAQLPGTIAVSAVNADLAKSRYSNYGRGEIDLAAPGGEPSVKPAPPAQSGLVLSTFPGDTLGYVRGTSMAAPHVSGAAALVKSVLPKADNRTIRKILLDSARPLACPPPGNTTAQKCSGPPSASSFYGSGLVSVDAAVQLALRTRH